MKRLYFSIFSIIISSFAILAQDIMYFQEGTQWIVEIYPDDPNEHYETETLTLQSIPGADSNIFALYTDVPRENYFDAHCLNIKVDGEKVYFHLVDDTCVVPSADDKGWYLMYDFGLEIGETCEVYNANAMRYYNDPAICKETLKCIESVGPEIKESFCNMYMENLAGGERGVWLKGVGAIGGPLNNCGFGSDGGSRLIGLIDNGKEIFNTPSASVNDIKDHTDFLIIKNGMTVTIPNLESDRTCYVYSVDGKLISIIDLSISNKFTMPAPGCYIIKIGDLTKKIIFD